jgi:O-antigen/teichoic acid export membrane protein
MECSNNRLVKNTVLLYIRTIVTLRITLFTSRVILNSLGVKDFGLYNVVGGFVTMFSAVSSSMTSTSQRVITSELGKVENSNVCGVFNVAMSIHLFLALVLLILFEIVGLPILNFVLNIPSGRLFAANCVYQLSVLSFLINLLATPFTALIIANEKMNVFAYISLLTAFLKLLVAYLINISPIDNLILYAILLFSISLLERFIYSSYSKIYFKEIKFKLIKKKKQFDEIFRFARMNFIGAFASIICTQGINILLNIYYGVTVNAARAISIQVQSSVERFTADFMTALNPQITKEYASGNIDRTIYLSMIGSKFSFFLMLFLSSFFIIRADYVLYLWLGIVPDYAVDLVRLSICISMLEMISNPVVTIILAHGDLKIFTFWIGGIRMVMIPVSLLSLCLGASPQMVYCIVIVFEILGLIVRLIIVNKMVGRDYLYMFSKNVLLRILVVFLLSYSIMSYFDRLMPNTFGWFVFSAILNISLTAAIIILLGISKDERCFLYNNIVNKVVKKLTKI